MKTRLIKNLLYPHNALHESVEFNMKVNEMKL